MFVLPYTHPLSPCSLLTLMLFLPPDTAPKAAKILAVNPTNNTIDPQPTVDNDISVTCRRRNQYSNQWHNMFNPRLIDPWNFRKENVFKIVLLTVFSVLHIISAGSIWIVSSSCLMIDTALVPNLLWFIGLWQEGYIEELTRFSQCLNAKTGFVNIWSVYQSFLYWIFMLLIEHFQRILEGQCLNIK